MAPRRNSEFDVGPQRIDDPVAEILRRACF